MSNVLTLQGRALYEALSGAIAEALLSEGYPFHQ